jgi:hypothetical protein
VDHIAAGANAQWRVHIAAPAGIRVAADDRSCAAGRFGHQHGTTTYRDPAREWIKNDSGYPAAWMPDVTRMLPKQVINVVPAGAGVAVMRESYGRSLRILIAVCSLVLLIACANVANVTLTVLSC